MSNWKLMPVNVCLLRKSAVSFTDSIWSACELVSYLREELGWISPLRGKTPETNWPNFFGRPLISWFSRAQAAELTLWPTCLAAKHFNYAGCRDLFASVVVVVSQTRCVSMGCVVRLQLDGECTLAFVGSRTKLLKVKTCTGQYRVKEVKQRCWPEQRLC